MGVEGDKNCESMIKCEGWIYCGSNHSTDGENGYIPLSLKTCLLNNLMHRNVIQELVILNKGHNTMYCVERVNVSQKELLSIESLVQTYPPMFNT